MESIDAGFAHGTQLFCARHRTVCPKSLRMKSTTVQLVRLEHNDSSSSEEEDAPPPKASTYDPPNRLRGGFKFHHISTLPPTANKKYPQRVCRLCSKNGIRRDTRFYCKDCKVALCNRPCFGDYQSKKHL